MPAVVDLFERRSLCHWQINVDEMWVHLRLRHASPSSRMLGRKAQHTKNGGWLFCGWKLIVATLKSPNVIKFMTPENMHNFQFGRCMRNVCSLRNMVYASQSQSTETVPSPILRLHANEGQPIWKTTSRLRYKSRGKGINSRRCSHKIELVRVILIFFNSSEMAEGFHSNGK